MPDILATLRPGLSEAEVASVERALGFQLPPALKVLYRLHDGQALLHDTMRERRIRQRLASASAGGSVAAAAVAAAAAVSPGGDAAQAGEDTSASELQEHNGMARSIFCGLFGGYAVYDHRVVSRMLPLRRAVVLRAEMLRSAAEAAGRRSLRPGTDRLLPFSCSYMYDKILVSDTEGGGIAVAKPEPGGFDLTEAAPKTDTRDGSLRWFEEYARRLAAGWYQVCTMDEQFPQLSRGISLFPASPPGLLEAVTRGVRVCASVVYVPEVKMPGRHLFAYSIRFSMTDDAPLKRCQLTHRHWIIRPEPGHVEEVEGPGVIGYHPILQPGEPEFVYCSCTHQEVTRGSMGGSFKFVPGTIDNPEGPPFDVVCPSFRLDLPEYIF